MGKANDNLILSTEEMVNHADFEPDKKVKATNIIWDVDDEDGDVDLPREIDIPIGMTDEEEISDYISDVTGYCHKGFDLVGC